jgi:nitroreductase
MIKMKNGFNRLIPAKCFLWWEKRRQKRIARTLYKRDFKKYLRYGFAFTNKDVKEKQLEARIVFHYHALEKGLSHLELRKGFGETALRGLTDAMTAYKKDHTPAKSLRYLTGLSVLKAYVEKHKALDYDASHVEKTLDTLSLNSENPESNGGVFNYSKERILKHAQIGFETLAMNRYSVRDFGKEAVPLKSIKASIEIAMKSPSVSNRQAWHVHIIKNKALIKDVLTVQGGLNGHGKNIDTLLLVTSDYTGLGDAGEYKQGHIDSGLFSMSLLYALTDHGVATCPLNADVHPSQDDLIRGKLNIKDEESLTMFIAVGSYPDTSLIPKSQRDFVDEHIEVYE